jgi:hypothetical protein
MIAAITPVGSGSGSALGVAANAHVQPIARSLCELCVRDGVSSFIAGLSRIKPLLNTIWVAAITRAELETQQKQQMRLKLTAYIACAFEHLDSGFPFM